MVPTHTKRAAFTIPARAAHSPVATQVAASSTGAGEIKSIRVTGEDLEVGDVVRRIPIGGTEELRIDKIVSRVGPYVWAICTNLKSPGLAAQQHKLGSANTMCDVIDGPKLIAARKDPTLVQQIPLGWNWKSAPKEAVSV